MILLFLLITLSFTSFFLSLMLWLLPFLLFLFHVHFHFHPTPFSFSILFPNSPILIIPLLSLILGLPDTLTPFCTILFTHSLTPSFRSSLYFWSSCFSFSHYYCRLSLILVFRGRVTSYSPLNPLCPFHRYTPSLTIPLIYFLSCSSIPVGPLLFLISARLPLTYHFYPHPSLHHTVFFALISSCFCFILVFLVPLLPFSMHVLLPNRLPFTLSYLNMPLPSSYTSVPLPTCTYLSTLSVLLSYPSVP